MKIYRVERMTNENYDKYMSGSYNYHVEYVAIEAETPEMAANKAEAEGYVVNHGYVKTFEEIKTEKKAIEKFIVEEERKKAEAKAKRKAAEAKRAAEAGLTVEEYRKEKAKKAKIKRIKKEIETLEVELAKKKAYLKKLEK